MGLYDREIEQELLAFCQIKPQQLDFINIKNIYDEMKRNILVEVYIPDVIHQLEDIQNAPSFQKDALINQYIDDLHHKVPLPSDIISYSNTIVAAIAYWIEKCTPYTVEESVHIIYQVYQKKNKQYGDAWFKHGDVGICRDMGRKMLRLVNSDNSKDDLTNTFFDIIDYCAFMNVYQKFIKKIK